MFRVEIKEENNLKTFLSLNDSEYIDAILDKTKTTLINSTREIFATITLDTIAIDEMESKSVRLPRKLLLNLLSIGYMLIDIRETDISLDFYEIQKESVVEKSCGVKFARQQIWAEGYLDKLQLITDLSINVVHDLSTLSDVIKIGNSNKSIISCDNGVACVAINNNCRVYREIDNSVVFSMNASSLLTLTRISPKVFDYKNYLGVIRDNLTIICTKVRHNDNADYELIMQEKSSFTAKIDMRYLQRFLSKIKITDDNVQVDLLRQNSVIEEGTKIYDIPIMVRELQKSNVCKECRFNINVQILDTISKAFAQNILYVCNKRTFVQLSNEDTAIVFRG